MRARIPLALALAAAAATAVAEVSVTRLSGGVVEVHFQPSPDGPWSRVRPDIPTIDMLNPQGDSRPDSWPSIASAADGRPSVAFSSPGHDGEVYVAWHDGLAWRPPVNVSRRLGSDHGASLALDEWGNRFVAWNNTRNGRVSVRFSAVANDGAGMLGVTELSCRQREPRKPSLGVAWDGDVYVAYEEHPSTTDDVPSIAIDRLVPPRDNDRSLHCSGENTADLWRTRLIRTSITDQHLMAQPEVHVEGQHVWVTWIDSRTRIGWVELSSPGIFGETSFRAFDPAAGTADALSAIRDQVLAP